jgi:hypothetical protein
MPRRPDPSLDFEEPTTRSKIDAPAEDTTGDMRALDSVRRAAINAFLAPMLAEVSEDMWHLVALAHDYQMAATFEAQHATPEALAHLGRARGDFRIALNLAIAKTPDELTTPFLILRALKAEVDRA